MKKHHLTLIVAAILAATLSHAPAQTLPGEIAEAPPTTKMKVESLQARHDKIITDLQTLFGRIAKDATLISSKETVEAIEQGDRELKNTRSALATVVASLRTESKAITAEPSFSDDQKTELLAAVEAMITKCDELTARTTVAINHLQGAYKVMPKWRKIHRTYRNLDGEANAAKQLETSVTEFVKGLTAVPAEKESTEPGETGSGDTSGDKAKE